MLTSGNGRGRSVVTGSTAAREEGAGQEPQAGGPAEQRDHVLGGERVGERVLPGPDLVTGGLARQDRRMAEHLALAEQVDGTSSIEELDRAPANHPDAALGLLALGQDP